MKNTSSHAEYFSASRLISSSFLRMVSAWAGSCFRCFIISRASSLERVPFLMPKSSASMHRETSWVVYALVDATAISGPAHVYSTSRASRATELPTTFVIARILAPRFRASLNAARVSAVSPDWLMIITSVFLSTIGSL